MNSHKIAAHEMCSLAEYAFAMEIENENVCHTTYEPKEFQQFVTPPFLSTNSIEKTIEIIERFYGYNLLLIRF